MRDKFESCTNCIHSDDSEEICILRLCKHAIAKTKECYEPKNQQIDEQSSFPCRHENDCISRQAAIAVADYTDYRGLTVEDVKKVTDEVVKGLKQLPSAQPESEERPLTEDDYAYCAECDHVEMCRWYPMYGCEFKSRPSAQPEEIIYCGECKHMMSNGRCRQFADHSIRLSASDYCSAGERR